MSTREPSDEFEFVVAEDGSIPAVQLGRLGIRPGARLRVVAVDVPSIVASSGLAGSLPDLPDIDWDNFQRASNQARQDHAQPSGSSPIPRQRAPVTGLPRTSTASGLPIGANRLHGHR